MRAPLGIIHYIDSRAWCAGGIRCAIGCLSALAYASAQDLAPESIANSIRQVFYITSPGNVPGPFSNLYSDNGGVYFVGSQGVGNSRTGSYSWTKTGPNTGTLRIPADASLTGLVELLTFTSPRSGTFRTSSNLTTGTFTFTPFELGEPAQVRNASTRMTLTATQPALVGFVMTGGTHRRVLVRAVGPSLVGFGVSGAAQAPVLTVFRGAVQVATNSRWGGEAGLAAAFASVGAFALPLASADSALLLTLEPGAYSAQVRDGAGGEVLVEVYFLN